MLYGGMESLTGDKKFRAMFSKEFYQKNLVAVTYSCSSVRESSFNMTTGGG